MPKTDTTLSPQWKKDKIWIGIISGLNRKYIFERIATRSFITRWNEPLYGEPGCYQHSSME